MRCVFQPTMLLLFRLFFPRWERFEDWHTLFGQVAYSEFLCTAFLWVKNVSCIHRNIETWGHRFIIKFPLQITCTMVFKAWKQLKESMHLSMEQHWREVIESLKDLLQSSTVWDVNYTKVAKFWILAIEIVPEYAKSTAWNIDGNWLSNCYLYCRLWQMTMADFIFTMRRKDAKYRSSWDSVCVTTWSSLSTRIGQKVSK